MERSLYKMSNVAHSLFFFRWSVKNICKVSCYYLLVDVLLQQFYI